MLPNVNKPSQSGAPPATAPDFEAALAELETLVERLEHGDQPLEQALADFERGVHLARSCQDALARAELRVRELTDLQTAPGADDAPGADPPA